MNKETLAQWLRRPEYKYADVLCQLEDGRTVFDDRPIYLKTRRGKEYLANIRAMAKGKYVKSVINNGHYIELTLGE